MTELSAGKIKVVTGYRGKATNEQYIAPGEYAADDPALFGLASFLVETGRAAWTVEPEKLPRQKQPADALEVPKKELPDDATKILPKTTKKGE